MCQHLTVETEKTNGNSCPGPGNLLVHYRRVLFGKRVRQTDVTDSRCTHLGRPQLGLDYWSRFPSAERTDIRFSVVRFIVFPVHPRNGILAPASTLTA